MRVFVTGATGWVGSAVVDDLVAAGHQVLGLTRSDQGATALAAAGAEVHRGSLEDLESLRCGAERSDAVIHTAFNHDFSRFAENCRQDGRAIEAIGTVLAGSDRPLVVTSGLAALAAGPVVTETDRPLPASASYARISETTAIALADRGIRATTVRLPPSVHGHGDHGFVPHLIALARETGVVATVGDGQNRWAAVHRRDAARVYRLVLERGVDGGPFHAVAEEGIALRTIADVIARRLNLPVRALSPDEASAHFGWFTMFAGMGAAASSEWTRARLDWLPERPGLLADVDHPAYFEG